ncbi:MAG: NAD(P)/FAD-dependent oxidoreductase [Coriobacteriia bacterium]|nr:NAD(P)/FAD-dependent oxidoreductase [Coriobacteriia bacterium]
MNVNETRDDPIAIIGAGIAGLSAGCYLQMNGYKTRIFEMHSLPGGVCTSWQRKDYTIDGCMHWLAGSGPASEMYRVWQELGVIKRHNFVDHDVYLQVEDREGRRFTLYTDPDRLERHMLEIAPEDSAAIKDFTGALRKMKGFDMPVGKAPELEGPFDRLKTGLKVLPYLGALRKWGKTTINEFAARLKNPFLREALMATVGDVDVFPMLGLLMPMTFVQAKAAGYPLGGSLEFAKTVEQRYLELGGTVSYNSRVEKVLVEGNSAVGIRLEDGTEYMASTTISAADGHSTIFEMLEGIYVDETIKGYYRDLQLFPPMLLVSFGIARTFDDPPPSVGGIHLPLEEPLTIAGKERKAVNLYVYNHDPSLSPAGKTVVKFILMTDYDYWEELYKDRERYREEKERIADMLQGVLEKRFPGVSQLIEMRDVATPMTWVRYTANWRASYEGWMMTMDSWNMRMSKTLPGLSNFYMVGQWVEPGGGLPPAALSGRNLAQILCKQDGKKFVTTVP